MFVVSVGERARKVAFEHSGSGRAQRLTLARSSEAEAERDVAWTWHTTSLQNGAVELPCEYRRGMACCGVGSQCITLVWRCGIDLMVG